MNRKLIGLCGPAGSGKDTVADYLVAHHGFIKLAFADRLRLEICNAWGIPERTLTDTGTKAIPQRDLALGFCGDDQFCAWYQSSDAGRQEQLDWSPPYSAGQSRTARWVMQQWGDFRRAGNPYYFIEALHDRLEALRGCNLIISDVRQTPAPYQDVEAHFVLTHGGQIWQLVRPGFNPGAHATEHAFSPNLIAHYALNGSSIAELHELTNTFLSAAVA